MQLTMDRTRGEYHPKAKLTNHEVELMRKMREEEGCSYNFLAKIFEVSKDHVVSLCKYRRR